MHDRLNCDEDIRKGARAAHLLPRARYVSLVVTFYITVVWPGWESNLQPAK